MVLIKLGELLEPPFGTISIQAPMSEKVQRLFRKEVGPSGPKRPAP